MKVWRTLLPVLALTLAVRVFWLWRFPVDPIEPVDAEGYHLIAVNVLAGRGFAIGWSPPFCPTVVRTPLYPMFLVFAYRVFGQEPSRVVLLHLLLEVLTAALTIRLARDLLPRSLPIAAGAGLAYALNGVTQRYSGYLLAESLLLPLLVAAVLVTLRCLRHLRLRAVVLSAGLWGAGVLVKPNIQYLALAVGCLVAARCASARCLPVRRRLVRAGAFWGAFLLALAPWGVRNRLLLGRWVISTAFEDNLARVGVVVVRASMAQAAAEPWTETWEYFYARFAADVRDRYGWCERTALRVGCPELQQRQSQLAAAARDEVMDHVWLYGRAHLRGALWSILDPSHRTWYRVLTGRNWEETGVAGRLEQRISWSLRHGAWGDAVQAFWVERVVLIPPAAAAIWWSLAVARLAVWIVGLRGLARLRRRPWVAGVLGASIAYIVFLPGPIAYDRFYLPAVPLVTALLSIGVGGRRQDRGNSRCG